MLKVTLAKACKAMDGQDGTRLGYEVKLPQLPPSKGGPKAQA